MKYICLIYDNDTEWARMPKDEFDATMGEYMALGSELMESGHMTGGARLERSHTATTVRVRGGALSTVDGPYAETKEQLSGYLLVEARDLNEAIQLAARIPGARMGAIEVRPVAAMGRTPT
ncbi:MAG TPA: YciI family protein [Gemmatirosa sp.]